ncbi:MAG: D-tagatose-bisphosphate aldolase, class II, non-catalytic subunit [Steroidobacteraceae bacterium]
MNALLEVVERHRAGAVVGITSVCSAHPLVIRAALEHAKALERCALIEATSNQVNQEGGYTGLVPTQFRDLVWNLADEVGLPRERVLLGGDHLGPNPWQSASAKDAMQRAEVMVMGYVSAGFRKIHLDCSMPCGDDTRPLSDALIAERNARLCARAEGAWRAAGGEAPMYIVGSEVPTPGGAHETLQELTVTRPEAALATLEAHRAAFLRLGLDSAWQRVIGLVVQPGVEFDDVHVIGYAPEKARRLSECIASQPHLVFEAHSTDYQSPEALACLVRDHFAILKVGPALTFALREAVFALDQIEREWLGEQQGSQVRATVLAAMRKNPRHWEKHYRGSGHALELELAYSLSDRIRYYWPVPEVAQAMAQLEASFSKPGLPLPLLGQYLPSAQEAVRRGEIATSAHDLISHHIRKVLAGYSAACDQMT